MLDVHLPMSMLAASSMVSKRYAYYVCTCIENEGVVENEEDGFCFEYAPL